MSRDERLGVGREFGHRQLLTVVRVIANLTMVAMVTMVSMVTMVTMTTHVVAGGGRPILRASGGLQAVSSADNVQNLRVEHVGLGVVHVFYDLVDDDPQTTFDVILQVSQDAGATFDLTATSVSGDAGQEIGVGGGKRIVWEAGRDVERMEVEKFAYSVVARFDSPLFPAASAGPQEWMTSLPDTTALLSRTATGVRLEFVGDSRYGGLGADLTPLEDEFVGSAQGPGTTCINGSWRLRMLTAGWQGSIRCGRSPVAFVLYSDRVTPSSSPNASEPLAAALSNEDVVGLVSAGISEDVVIAVIRESQTQFSVGTEQLAELRDAGVSEQLLAVMREVSPVPEVAASEAALTSTPTPLEEPPEVLAEEAPRPEVVVPEVAVEEEPRPEVVVEQEVWNTNLPGTIARLRQTASGLQLELVGSGFANVVDLLPEGNEFTGTGPARGCLDASWRLGLEGGVWRGSFVCGRRRTIFVLF